MNKHSCIKCQTEYESPDIDPYYCSTCEEEKKVIAKEIDAKFASRPKNEVKKLDIDALPKIKSNVPGGWMIDSRHLLP